MEEKEQVFSPGVEMVGARGGEEVEEEDEEDGEVSLDVVRR